jgi:hypothetical protein
MKKLFSKKSERSFLVSKDNYGFFMIIIEQIMNVSGPYIIGSENEFDKVTIKVTDEEFKRLENANWAHMFRNKEFLFTVKEES